MISPALHRQLEALICCQERPALVTLWLPLIIPSVANLRECWAKKATRTKKQRSAAYLLLKSHTWRKCPDAVVVRIVRQAPRLLDSHDNLPRSMKGVIDGCADALGVDDRDPRVRWVVDQQKGRQAGVIIELYVP